MGRLDWRGNPLLLGAVAAEIARCSCSSAYPRSPGCSAAAFLHYRPSPARSRRAETFLGAASGLFSPNDRGHSRHQNTLTR